MKVFLCVKPNGGKVGWRIVENLFCRLVSCLMFLQWVKKKKSEEKHEMKKDLFVKRGEVFFHVWKQENENFLDFSL